MCIHSRIHVYTPTHETSLTHPPTPKHTHLRPLLEGPHAPLVLIVRPRNHQQRPEGGGDLCERSYICYYNRCLHPLTKDKVTRSGRIMLHVQSLYLVLHDIVYCSLCSIVYSLYWMFFVSLVIGGIDILD